MRLGESVRNGVGIIALVALLLAPPIASNQPAGVAWAQTPDPPARVGRLNDMSGPVSFAPGGLNQWAQATLNYPLTTGTALWTDENGRAELHIGSTAVRMDQMTELDILNLDDQIVQLRLAQGTLDIGLHQLAADERFEVATPSASIALVRPGHYRFRAADDGVRVTVWKGQVDVATSAYTFPVYAGQTILVSDSGSQIVATPAPDAFGQWALEREAREEQALQLATQYVSPTMTGYEDLGTYGAWRVIGGYGAVWFPTVQPGWAPYRYGRWVWISPWGWTWIDSAPWGFAPFHYGRWVLMGGIWAWVPGPALVRPVFAPALVVFVVIGDVIGWFPLAPHEVYVPPYHASPIYYRRININIVNVNITNIHVTNIRYAFHRSPGAITLVRQDAFVQAVPVAASIVSTPQTDIERARVIASAPVRPDVRSLVGNPQGSVGSHRPPVAVEQRPVVVRQAPPAPPRPPVTGVEAPVRNVLVRPVAAPVQPGNPAPQPRPQPLQPAVPGPNPVLRPAPTPPQVAPVAPQIIRPAPHAPRNQVRVVVCDQRSPHYDPRQCPQSRPRRH